MHDNSDVADKVYQSCGHNGLHTLDIADEASLNIAGSRRCEKLERHSLEMGKELPSNVAHDFLSDNYAEITIEQSEKRAENGCTDDQPGIKRKDVELLLGYALVNDGCEPKGRQDSETGSDDDGDNGLDDLFFVGSEEGNDPSDDFLVGSLCCWWCRFFVHGLGLSLNNPDKWNIL